MRRNLLFFGVLCLSVLLWSTFAWSQQDPNDSGLADTLYVEPYPPDTLFPGPGHFVRVPIYVTHDVPNPVIDSIMGFVIPLCYTHTNPSGYCSLSAWWNNTDLYPLPTTDRSIFRHLPNMDDPTEINWMMALSEREDGSEWDTRVLDLDGTSRFWMALIPISWEDQRFWEGSRVLLATMTFKVEDTMTVCVDSCFWPPTMRLSFTRSDAISYIPRHNLPYCFRIGPLFQPDFIIEATPDTQTVQAGQSTNYGVILTSLFGFDSPCNLSATGLPDDASADFDPNPVIPTAISVMSISTAVTTPSGTYDLIITATELTKAQIQHSTQVVLIVTPPPDFTIEALPETLEVAQGGEGSYEVILTSLYGFNSPCTLTVSGLPPDAPGEFDPATLIPTGTSALAVSMAETTPTGGYPLIITATGPSKARIEHSTQVVLIVTPSPDPRIISITDVSNDQGKQVRVKWDRCYYDVEGSDTTITEYGIWRRIGEDKSNSQSDEMWLSDEEMFGVGRIYPPGDWDFIKTVPARGESVYNTVCPTLGDSTQAGGMYWSVFFVSAMTSNPLVYFDSNPDSGYSLDNIPPLPIMDFNIDPNSWFTLLWTVPGEYVGEQPISTYDIRYNTVPVGADTQAWWDSAEDCDGDGFFNFIVGEEDSFGVAEESGCHPDVYFAIKGLDSRPNASGISNIVHFLCGDVNGDGVVELGDVVKVINYLYRGGPPPEPIAAGDVTCDGIVDIGDVVYLINYLYRGGPPPCSP